MARTRSPPAVNAPKLKRLQQENLEQGIYLFIYYLLKLYSPSVHNIAFANKFQL